MRQDKIYYLSLNVRCNIYIYFNRTQAKAVQLDWARTLQASATQQSTGSLATKAAALHVDQKRTLLITPVNTQIGCQTGQNLNSTAIAESSYRTLEHHLREEQKQKLCLLEQLSTGTYSELWETEGVVKRSLFDIIKSTNRSILPSTEDWKYSKPWQRGSNFWVWSSKSSRLTKLKIWTSKIQSDVEAFKKGYWGGILRAPSKQWIWRKCYLERT